MDEPDYINLYKGNYDYPIESDIGESWWREDSYEQQLINNIFNDNVMLQILKGYIETYAKLTTL
jgi:hypothetical protein